MKNLFTIGVAAFALAMANIGFSQTNGWPIAAPGLIGTPNAPFAGTVGQPSAPPLNAVTLSPFTTNSYAAGTAGQVFIGTQNADSISLSFSSIVPTNTASTNLAGNITLRLSKTIDGVTLAESVPSIVLTLNSTGNGYSGTNTPATASIFTNLNVAGCLGLFVTSLESTNAGVNGPTNVVTLKTYVKPTAITVTPATQYNQ